MSVPYRDRTEGGQVLAAALLRHDIGPRPIVLALPRGGVPVGYEVAKALGAPLDVFVVRKLGTPGHEELAMGAIATGGVRVLNEEVSRFVHPSEIEEVTAREEAELARREREYREGRPPLPVEGRDAILVDDGLATGASMRAAVLALRELRPARIVVAVPVASRESCEEFAEMVDLVVCPLMPEPFYAVGLWYERFPATKDDEVRELLAAANRQPSTDHQPEG
ncbi:MAG: phosphoribosyltransferase [Dehalococcoidia bacterium]|nr:phosphoribosyltransferase [Dehalococcoidia bacterium]